MKAITRAKQLLVEIEFSALNDQHLKACQQLVAQALITAHLEGKVEASREIKKVILAEPARHEP